MLVQVQGAGELLEVHHVGHLGLAEAQHGERPARRGVTAPVERHDLDGDVAHLGHLGQVAQLGSHHLAAAHRAPQRPLVQHRPHLRGIRAGQQVLALEPHAHPPVDLITGRPGVAEQGDRPGVVLGLEQAVHELQLEGPDDRGGHLQAQVGLEPVGHDVAVLGPPARRVGLPGQPHQPVPDLLVGDAVQRQQVGDVPLLEPDEAVLHPADLGPGSADLVGRLLRRDAGRVAEPVQLDTHEHAGHGRTLAVSSRLVVPLNRAHASLRELIGYDVQCRLPGQAVNARCAASPAEPG